MKFNEGKFEQMAHGYIKDITLEPYKTPCGEVIQIKDTAKDLGVLATNDLEFREHINNITTSSKIIMGMLLRTFNTRKIVNCKLASLIEKRMSTALSPGTYV